MSMKQLQVNMDAAGLAMQQVPEGVSLRAMQNHWLTAFGQSAQQLAFLRAPPPTQRQRPTTVEGVLREVYTLLDHDGWIKGSWHVGGQGYCMAGAVRKVVGAHNALLAAVYERLIEAMPSGVPALFHSNPEQLVYCYNDNLGSKAAALQWLADAMPRPIERAVQQFTRRPVCGYI